MTPARRLCLLTALTLMPSAVCRGSSAEAGNPPLADVIWTGQGDTSDYYSASLAAAGDVNKDGYGDVLVASAEGVNSGYAYLYLGGLDEGLGTTAAWHAGAGVGGVDALLGFRLSISSAGDVNGDGYADVILGFCGTGEANVYLGSSSGLSEAVNWYTLGVAGGYGFSVSSAGDVNGDGFSDVIVGEPDFYLTLTAHAYLYLGSSSGLATSPAWTVQAEDEGDFFGASVASAGDVNGDGYADVVVGAQGYAGYVGKAYVYLGSSSGLATTAAWSAQGEGSSRYGGSVSSAGDVNGDGYADVIVGANDYMDGLGKAYVYLGSASGLGTSPAWSAEGEADGNTFGDSVSSAGDVNGDGYADVVIGAANNTYSLGHAYLYLGSSSGPGTTYAWSSHGEGTLNEYGAAVSSAGDVNGDGLADVIVGDPDYESSSGKAYVYRGLSPDEETPTPEPTATPEPTSTPVDPVLSDVEWTDQGKKAEDRFGVSVASAGDVNGDGYEDVIVGANGVASSTGFVFVYLGSSSGLGSTFAWGVPGEAPDSFFGYPAASAGDVNGDGYADEIVGAFGYAGNTGKVYLYLGSPSGLETTAAWSAEGEDAESYYGYSVSSAGDVNGDGYADVIVGAYKYTSATGKAYLYLGSSSGLGTPAAWTALGEATSNDFGHSVSSAGDVNGDGYADVIVGAFGNSSSVGKIYVYLGSSSGLGTTAAWTDRGEDDSEQLGTSVATAGDVNGDGYADVIVAADGYSTLKCQAFVYLGSSSGLAASFAWSYSPGEVCTVSPAGDVNGDGYSEVLVGDQHPGAYQGKAFLFTGSSSGLGTTAAWTGEGEEAYNYYGGHLSSAGDVNGDGAADVIVGALGYSSYRGKAYLYLGLLSDDLIPAPDSSPTPASDSSPTPEPGADAGGCGCDTHADPQRSGSQSGALALLAAVGLLVRRRR